ncbi:MAG TPA: ABC transporter permease, partial [Actinopolymorphaceae bacterium]|nr:ABC transporter permease [Actinopolymorphaceae bacterium]
MTELPAEIGLPAVDVPADGAAAGFHAEATLTVRTEIRRQWSRRRTRLTLGLVLVLPAVLVGAFKLGTQDSETSASFVGLATSNAGNFTVFTLGAAAGFLLTITVALLCGDTVASEASCGSLR